MSDKDHVNATAAVMVRRFDLRAEPIVLKASRWTPHIKRDPRHMRGVVLHSWGVPVGTEARLRMRHGGEAEALARRALAAPYNICAGTGILSGEPVVVLAHPVERYTYASDAACRDFVSVGIFGRFPLDAEVDDGRPRTDITPALVAAVSAALDEAVAMLPAADRPYMLITHRQAVNGQNDHDACPGEDVVRMALMSRAVREGLLVPDADLVLVRKYGSGWPDSWRRHLSEDITPRPHAPTTQPLPPLPVMASGSTYYRSATTPTFSAPSLSPQDSDDLSKPGEV